MRPRSFARIIVTSLALQVFVLSAPSQSVPVLSKNIGQIQFADQYLSQSGNDIGVAISTAIQALPGGCGTVEIATGTFNFSGTIVKPRCVVVLGQGAGATHLVYTSTSGTAVAIGDGAGTQQYLHGGIRDLSIESTHPAPNGSPIAGANGVFMGGDPSGALLGTNYAAEAQDLTNVRITGFGTPLTLGSNVYWETFQNLQIVGNAKGISELSNAINSGEAINFFGGYVSGNTAGAFANANFENHLFGTSIDFNGAGGPEITNSNIECHSCHFEVESGPFYSGSQFVAYGGIFLVDADSGTDATLFTATGTEATFRLDGAAIASNHVVTQLLNWQAGVSYGGELTLRKISGNGNYKIGNGQSGLPILVGSGFTVFPGVDIDCHFNSDMIVLNGSSPVFGGLSTGTGGIVISDTNGKSKYRLQVTNGSLSLTQVN